jgi:Mg2+ and Co2+ transporter CorA
MKEHDDIMRKYYDTVDKYTRMMEKVEDERYRVEGDILDQGKTKLTEISKRDQLTLKKNQSSSEVTHLNTTVTVYKKQMQDLV